MLVPVLRSYLIPKRVMGPDIFGHGLSSANFGVRASDGHNRKSSVYLLCCNLGFGGQRSEAKFEAYPSDHGAVVDSVCSVICGCVSLSIFMHYCLSH